MSGHPGYMLTMSVSSEDLFSFFGGPLLGSLDSAGYCGCSLYCRPAVCTAALQSGHPGPLEYQRMCCKQTPDMKRRGATLADQRMASGPFCTHAGPVQIRSLAVVSLSAAGGSGRRAANALQRSEEGTGSWANGRFGGRVGRSEDHAVCCAGDGQPHQFTASPAWMRFI